MEIFFDLFGKIIPLYFIVLLGYLAGTYFKVTKESIATLLIYFIAPLVVFNGVVTAVPDASLIVIPLFFFLIAVVVSALFYFFGKMLWPGTEKNILAFAAGTGNTGYFGLPVVLALFGEAYLSVAVLCILGIVLYEHSVGYYFVARGTFTSRDALLKVCKLPALYAFVCGVVFLFANLSITEELSALFSSFRGAYTVLGMMLIGLGLAGITRAAWDGTFLAATFVAKFVVWPVLVIGFIVLDRSMLHVVDETVYPILLILSVVPLASNTVAFASQLNTVPEKAALAVLASTIFALLFIPLFVTWVFPLVF